MITAGHFKKGILGKSPPGNCREREGNHLDGTRSPGCAEEQIWAMPPCG
jgi:hypothetical protein